MPPSDETKILSSRHPQRANAAFADYARAEKDRLQSFGEIFDEPLFDEAVDLVMRKLGKMEDEGKS